MYGGFMGCGGELHPGEHVAIVEPEVFSKARALLDENGGPRGAGGRNPDHILRGLLFCACCGAAFTPASTRRGTREHRYYRCGTRDRQAEVPVAIPRSRSTSRPRSKGSFDSLAGSGNW